MNQDDDRRKQIDRRSLLAGSMAIGLTSEVMDHPVVGKLDRIAVGGHRRFGTAVAWGDRDADRASFANPLYVRIVEADCGLIVPENEMKWQALRPSPTGFSFARCDALLGWAATQGLAVRGHNLLWHQDRWLPEWLKTFDFGTIPSAGVTRLVSGHIRTVVGRYGPQVRSWDVVNEAVRPADGKLYETVLSHAMGGAEPVLDLAFLTARAAAPTAQLVYNDYMGWEPGDAAHRAGVLRLLEGFRRRGTPVDALGLQSHLTTRPAGIGEGIGRQQAEWRRFLDAVTAMGYDLLVTELDVRDDHLPSDPEVRDRGVAEYARAYLDVTLAQPRAGDVLCWGLCDRYSWIEGLAPRADGAPRRPTPYDAQFRAKPLRAAIAAALAGAPPATPRSIGTCR